MSWQEIEGHDRIAKMFARAYFRSRLEGSFLFTGPAGIGKRAFALALAKTILCLKTADLEGTLRDGGSDESIDLSRFVPCGECESCRLFDYHFGEIKEEIIRSQTLARRKVSTRAQTGTSPSAESAPSVPNHPDFYYVSRPSDKTTIPLELLIGPKEERSRSGLCYELSRTPFLGSRKVAVIDDADYLNAEGANALLKTLEEPPERSVLILIGTCAAKQLPTIRSRCQTLRFAPLASVELAKILYKEGETESLEEGLRRSKFANGSLTRARELGDESFDRFRSELLAELSKPVLNLMGISAKMMEFVDAGGKEGQKRRNRLSMILGWSADFYRDLTRVFSGDESFLRSNPASAPFIKRVAEGWGVSLENGIEPDEKRILWLTAATERTIEAQAQIDRMANLPYIVEAWLADLRSANPTRTMSDV